jgi:AAHS family 4-hydroxybenzoate transporter-like MFS transporter
MAIREWPADKIKKALRWVAAGDVTAVAKIEEATSFIVRGPAHRKVGSPLRIILSGELRVGTLMLWLAYFMGLLLYFLLTSWIPILIRDAGSSVGRAAFIGALFPLGGGIGALACGWLMDRMNATRVVSTAYLVSAVLLLILARTTNTVGPLMVMMFLAGLAMNGAQTSMPVLAAMFYPTEGRASGVAWMLGVGRFGGVLGALSGGVLLQAGLTMASIIAGLAIVSLIAAVALLFKDIAGRPEAQHMPLCGE